LRSLSLRIEHTLRKGDVGAALDSAFNHAMQVLQEMGGWETTAMVRRYAHLRPSIWPNTPLASEVVARFWHNHPILVAQTRRR